MADDGRDIAGKIGADRGLESGLDQGALHDGMGRIGDDLRLADLGRLGPGPAKRIIARGSCPAPGAGAAARASPPISMLERRATMSEWICASFSISASWRSGQFLFPGARRLSLRVAIDQSLGVELGLQPDVFALEIGEGCRAGLCIGIQGSNLRFEACRAASSVTVTGLAFRSAIWAFSASISACSRSASEVSGAAGTICGFSFES